MNCEIVTELLLSAPESEGEMAHHHFLPSHPKNQPLSSINKSVNRSTHVKATFQVELAHYILERLLFIILNKDQKQDAT